MYSSFTILHSTFCFYTFYERQYKKAGIIEKNVRETAFSNCMLRRKYAKNGLKREISKKYLLLKQKVAIIWDLVFLSLVCRSMLCERRKLPAK